METINLEPHYSTNKSIGRCVKCAAEHEMNSCLMALLGNNNDEDEEVTVRKFEALVTFLKSHECSTLIEESERYLSEGKKVNVKLSIVNGKTKYELEISE